MDAVGRYRELCSDGGREVAFRQLCDRGRLYPQRHRVHTGAGRPGWKDVRRDAGHVPYDRPHRRTDDFRTRFRHRLLRLCLRYDSRRGRHVGDLEDRVPHRALLLRVRHCARRDRIDLRRGGDALQYGLLLLFRSGGEGRFRHMGYRRRNRRFGGRRPERDGGLLPGQRLRSRLDRLSLDRPRRLRIHETFARYGVRGLRVRPDRRGQAADGRDARDGAYRSVRSDGRLHVRHLLPECLRDGIRHLRPAVQCGYALLYRRVQQGAVRQKYAFVHCGRLHRDGERLRDRLGRQRIHLDGRRDGRHRRRSGDGRPRRGNRLRGRRLRRQHRGRTHDGGRQRGAANLRTCSFDDDDRPERPRRYGFGRQIRRNAVEYRRGLFRRRLRLR